MAKELFIYHAAAVTTISAILQEGLVADEESYRSNMEADLEALAQ